jgi:periplasmic protein TonB
MKNSRFYILAFVSLLVFNSWGQTEPVEIIDFPDVEASFPGGAVKMRAWIDSNMIYPDEYAYIDNYGKVFVSFVVEIDGSLTNVKVERSVSKLLDDEAKRLINAMPNWIPAEVDGKPVRCRCALPIAFNL